VISPDKITPEKSFDRQIADRRHGVGHEIDMELNMKPLSWNPTAP
jgi:hypothetical protein